MKTLEELAKELDFENGSDFYDYIVSSVINGQRSQAKRLFKEMQGNDQVYFLNSYLDDQRTHEAETKKICIEAICE